MITDEGSIALRNADSPRDEIGSAEGSAERSCTTNEGFYGQNICDGDSRPPFASTWEIVNAPIRSLDWSVSTAVLRARYSAEVEGRKCQPNSSNPSAPLNIELVEEVRLAASGLTLEDLLQGVVITTETAHGTPSMRIWAELN